MSKKANKANKRKREKMKYSNPRGNKKGGRKSIVRGKNTKYKYD
jgi:hypothetical protein